MQEVKKGALYVVGTPIGNLGDISPRALFILSEVDFIAAEDTRVTVKLLNRYEIKKPLVSYFEHNRQWRGELIIKRLLDGESAALVSDAGMPAISDPGEALVARCADEGIEVFVIPGPTAAVSALAVSGLPTGRFTFEGFVSVNKLRRSEHLASLINEKRTMVFYEAPHKLRRTLIDMEKFFGDRKIAIVREITKLHEDTWRGFISQALKYYSENDPKGEIVLVVAGAEDTPAREYSLDEASEMAQKMVDSGMSLSDAAKHTAKATGIKKGDIYRFIVDSY